MDEISRAIGELKGTIESNHAETLKRFDDQATEIKELQKIHWKQKGMMSAISLLVAAVFHGILSFFKGT